MSTVYTRLWNRRVLRAILNGDEESERCRVWGTLFENRRASVRKQSFAKCFYVYTRGNDLCSLLAVIKLIIKIYLTETDSSYHNPVYLKWLLSQISVIRPRVPPSEKYLLYSGFASHFVVASFCATFVFLSQVTFSNKHFVFTSY